MTKEMEEELDNFLEAGLAAYIWYTSGSKAIAELEKRLGTKLAPHIEKYFTLGKQWSSEFMKDEFVKANKRWDLDLKYNRKLIETFNDKYSIFQGYYDTTYKDMFKAREIDAMKRAILTAKYSGVEEKIALQSIRNTSGITLNRARLLYRYEKAQLDTTAHQVYFEDGLKEEYDKVWDALNDARDTHKALDGQIADKNGYFETYKGRTFGPPLDYNCRCKVKFVPKK